LPDKSKISELIDKSMPNAQDLLLVVTTISNNVAAKTLAHQIIANKLAACCNIIPNISSIYMWNNELCDDNEYLIVIKTTKNRYLQLEAFIQEQHPYEVPELIVFSAQECSNKYLSWVLKQTI
jgi:periplasmic divalent cation tolerance protein